MTRKSRGVKLREARAVFEQLRALATPLPLSVDGMSNIRMTGPNSWELVTTRSLAPKVRRPTLRDLQKPRNTSR